MSPIPSADAENRERDSNSSCPPVCVKVLWASQTGCAESVAKTVYADLEKVSGITVELVCMQDYIKKKLPLEEEDVLVFVVSSTGEGDPPDNGVLFTRVLNRKNHPPEWLKKVKYTILGLGDTNYTSYQGNPRKLEKLLRRHSAEPFLPRGEADDAVGLEEVVEPWREKMIKAVKDIVQDRSVEAVQIGESSAVGRTDSATQCTEKLVEKSEDQSTSLPSVGETSGFIPLEFPGRSKQRKEWKLEDWLENIAMTAYLDIFRSAQVTSIEKMASMTNEALQKLGVSNLRHRKTLIAEIGVLYELGGPEHVNADEVGAQSATKASGKKKVVIRGKRGMARTIGTAKASAGKRNGDLMDFPAPRIRLEFTDNGEEFSAMAGDISAAVDDGNLADSSSEDESGEFNEGAAGLKASMIIPGGLTVYSARVADARVLTTQDAIKKVWHVELALPDEVTYTPGQSFGIVCNNTPEDVDALLRRLRLHDRREREFRIVPATSPDDVSLLPSHIPSKCTIDAVFRHHVDILLRTGAGLSKRLLRALMEYCTSKEDVERLSSLCSDNEQFRSFANNCRPSLLDILNLFPSCKPTLAHLLDLLPPLSARSYSAASSQAQAPHRLHFCFSVTKFSVFASPDQLASKESTMVERRGLCTSWLDRTISSHQKDNQVLHLPVFIRPSTHFTVPDTVTVPWVMIGPGTGIAPFIGFLEHRRHLLKSQQDSTAPKDSVSAMVTSSSSSAAVGESWLFFGCRNRESDFLYKKELENFENEGTLTRLVTAFSREKKGEITYVQHRLEEHKADLCDLILKKKGIIFVCGDLEGMARDVRNTVHDIIVAEVKGSGDGEEAWKNLLSEGRFVVEAWS